MRIIVNLCTGLVILKLVAAAHANESTTDSVVIEASGNFKPRQPRHIWLTTRMTTWAQALGDGSPCLTTKGQLGSCTSFRKCYPYFKVPDLSVWESWVLGNYDTCSYFNDEGRQAFGVCCTNPITSLPSTETSTESSISTSPAVVGSGNEVDEGLKQKPPKNNNYPSWPPPIPTHPPDHTAATHPPAFTTSTVASLVSDSTSKKPVSTTWPTKPMRPTGPNQPTNPPMVWPPPVPTHPPTPSFELTTTSSVGSPGGGAGEGGSFNVGCGMKNGNPDTERIVGGHNADPNEWPWIAALFNNGRQFCGGSLIDNIHILTAAHCVAHMSSWDVARLSVKLGDHNIRSNTEVTHIERRVKRLVRHRGFDSRTLYNDVAVLTMDQPVQYTKSVRPICLPGGGSSRAYNGLTATVIGWGSLRENGPQPAVLQEVNLPIWTNGECSRKYGAAAPGGIIESMLCAGQAAKDSCSGDSGGPLMINDGRWTQVGVVSWGIGCGKGQYPGVYTRVTSFMPWITKNSKDN
ncbi:putative serine protease 29 [Malaya genurostris]|uniref:putative serine protease 29 n=1 Tax=Malaya genurostris TaxID=325434 RepID=UPI0026F3D246|nr:putative serine protease 29 [Malaya genurostris]XP_058447266.1 putative serine protease 29 [Malaya genurostris]